MADKSLNTRICLRRGSALEWASTNPILLEGEVGIESDTLRYKVGDGATAWSSLSYNDDNLAKLFLENVFTEKISINTEVGNLSKYALSIRSRSVGATDSDKVQIWADGRGTTTLPDSSIVSNTTLGVDGNFYVGNKFYVENGGYISGGMSTDDMFPNADAVDDIGTLSKRYKDLYLSGSIKGNGVIGTNQLLADSVTEDKLSSDVRSKLAAVGGLTPITEEDYIELLESGQVDPNKIYVVTGTSDNTLRVVQDAIEVLYDNEASSLTATSVQGAIDELVAGKQDNLTFGRGITITSNNVSIDLNENQWNNLVKLLSAMSISSTSSNLVFNAQMNCTSYNTL